MADDARRKRIMSKIEELKNQIKELGTEIERERNENSEEDSAIRQELLDKRDILEQQIAELHDSLAMLNNDNGLTKDIGKEFTIEINGTSRQLLIVLPDEASPSAGRISVESPLAKALLGRKQGETVEVETPVGTQIYKIAAVKLA